MSPAASTSDAVPCLRIPRRNIDLLATRARPDLTIRTYSDQQLADFLEADQLDAGAGRSLTRTKPDGRSPGRMSKVDRTTRVLFDASCLIAAVASPAGGSGFLWSLIEVEPNLARKFTPAMLVRHRAQLVAGAPELAAIPRLDVSPRRYPPVNAKDEHVVAAALASGAPFILTLATLDRPLGAEINGARLGVLALRPGEFISTHLPSHPSFATLRDARDP